ncbi:MAG: acyltransferase [Oculatellaceae cyanobacterium Prado106]|jgi:peptidoglycan/LPS O-acetylase OafA/YrhL|nr:acyltransferase [Oculatellaceae cyanobacterium Prado106]
MSNALQRGHLHRDDSIDGDRLTGLDLVRGIAAFAVVILHADEGMRLAPIGWTVMLNLAAFAVPFFLAASFYLTVGKWVNRPTAPNWRSRCLRLVIPYAIWSGIYLSQDILRALLKHQPEQLVRLLAQLPAIVFLGQAGFHLYFIPLLLTGTGCIAVLVPWLKQRWSVSKRIGFVIASLILYQIYRSVVYPDAVSLLQDGDSGLLILVSVLGYAVRCLPYIAIAFLLNHTSIRSYFNNFCRKNIIFLSLLFILLVFIQVPHSIQAVRELSLGYSAVFLALGLSAVIPTQPWIRSLGDCSFGIYLMHLLGVELLWSLLTRLGLPSGIFPLWLPLGVALIGFGVSWGITAIALRQPRISKLMFGVAGS